MNDFERPLGTASRSGSSLAYIHIGRLMLRKYLTRFMVEGEIDDFRDARRT